MKPYLAIAAIAIIAGASAYSLDGPIVAMKVFAISFLLPAVFLVGYRYWISHTKK